MAQARGARQTETAEIIVDNINDPRPLATAAHERNNKTSYSPTALHYAKPEAERLIEWCEHGNPHGSEIPFDEILDRVVLCVATCLSEDNSKY